ncbi:hypothetical protein Tco_0679333 [Tanacetum coccineum]|uniref:Uncharacterized protein n=1 Tax=Tanacetum coccineum TaxID=301880 RepID=A0ABQ4XHT4_9ASTR
MRIQDGEAVPLVHPREVSSNEGSRRFIAHRVEKVLSPERSEEFGEAVETMSSKYGVVCHCATILENPRPLEILITSHIDDVDFVDRHMVKSAVYFLDLKLFGYFAMRILTGGKPVGRNLFEDHSEAIPQISLTEIGRSGLDTYSWICMVQLGMVFLLSRIQAEPKSLSSATSDDTAWVEELVLILATTALFLD